MNPTRKALIGAAFVGSTLLGGAFGASLISTSATADTSSTTIANNTATAPAAAPDPTKGGHTANGITEALLTGDTAAKVKAAAEAAVPGGTVLRVENDAEGSPYEAHMTKADGSHVTVKVGSDFKVTSIENGR
jgi:hypothetical protein